MKSLILAVLIAMAGCLSTAVAKEAATRVALVSAGGGEAGKDVLMLAETQVGGEPTITLLDRHDVERVLQEQKLTLLFAGDSSQALAVGKIFRVEVFVALETLRGEKAPLGLVAFDAQTGVRLHDVTLRDRGAEETAQAVAGAVKAACAKRNRGPGTLRTVCLLAVRNADLPRAMDSHCQALAAMVERFLTRSAGLAVLERKRLENVNKERKLPTLSPGGDLSASLLTIELEAGRGPEGKGLRATAFVADVAGKRLAEPTAVVSNDDISALASALLRELLKSLKAAPLPAAGNPNAEARRFCGEARFLREHRDLTAALAAAESAYALAPDVREYAVELATELLDAAYCLLYPERTGAAAFSPSFIKRSPAGGKEAFELAQRALDLRIEDWRRNLGRYRGPVDFGDVDWRLRQFCSQSVREGEPVSFESRPAVLESPWPAEARPAVQAFREAYHRQLMAMLMHWAVAGPNDPTAANAFDGLWVNANEWALLDAAPDARGYLADLHAVIGRWLESWKQQAALHGEYSAGRQPKRYYDETLCFFIVNRDPNPILKYSVWAPRHFALSPRDYAPLAPLFQAMREHPVALVQEYGMWAQIWLARNCGSPGPSFDEFKKLIHDRIERPNEEPADVARLHHYVAMLRALRHIPMDDFQRQQERLKLANFMLDRGEMVGSVSSPERGNVVWEALSVRQDTREAAKRQLSLITRAKAALEGRVKIITDWDKERFAAEMGRILEDRTRTIGSNWPDLAPPAPKVPWKTARALLKCDGNMLLVGPVVHKRALLAVRIPNSIRGTEFEALSVPLDAGSVRSLGKASFDASREPPLRCGIEATCVGGGYYFVSPIDDGIVAFPLSGGDILRIGAAQQFPSKQVRAMAWLDGKLYVALADGYLVRCDLAGGPCEILASSRSKECRSPWDDSPPFSVPYMAADEERHRLLFVTNTPARIESHQKTNGLWCYDPSQKSFERLVEINPFVDTSGGSSICNDKILLWQHVNWVLQVDLKTAKPSLLYSFNRSEVVSGLTAQSTPYKNLPMVFGPYAEVDGWLWWVHGFGRISKGANLTQALPWPGGVQAHNTGFMYLEPTCERRQVITGDNVSFWLLTLDDHATP